MAHGLDANTAFSIVSIDIADIDVGENIGARRVRSRLVDGIASIAGGIVGRSIC
jgi:uncharacterized protein YqfA (UPF0365 family)